MKKKSKSLFQFHRNQEKGLLVLCVIILFASIGIHMLPFMIPQTHEMDYDKLEKLLATIPEQKSQPAQLPIDVKKEFSEPEKKIKSTSTIEQQIRSKPLEKEVSKIEYFTFDPNTITKENLNKLGLPNRVVNTLINFRNAGAKFYNPEDILKVNGLSSQMYERLKSYIIIPTTTNNSHKHYTSNFTKNTYTKKKPQAILINTADAEEFQQLYGIGPSISKIIVNFRNSLGGYHSIDQLKDVYALNDSTYQQITRHLVLDTIPLKTLNINSVTKEELAAHPYIHWKQAKIIANYAKQRYPMQSKNELYDIIAFDSAYVNKILPYLNVDTDLIVNQF